jgi:hypothetical protein
MDILMSTLVLAAVFAAVFPIAFLLARMCLLGVVRVLPGKAQLPQGTPGK